MDPAKVVDSLKEALTPLAEALAKGGIHIYQIAARQAMAEAIVNYVWAGMYLLIAVALSVAMFFVWKFYTKAVERDGGWDADLIAGGVLIWIVFSGLMAVLLFAGFGGSISEGILKSLNPEWYGIKALLEAAKGAAK